MLPATVLAEVFSAPHAADLTNSKPAKADAVLTGDEQWQRIDARVQLITTSLQQD